MKFFISFLILSFSFSVFANKDCKNTFNEEANLSPEVKDIIRTAEEGNDVSQFILANMHLHGSGVRKSKEDSFKWLKRSAEQGNAMAKNNLAIMYGEGKVVDKDLKEAARLFRESADLGNAEAQYNLGIMHERGQGGLEQSKEIAMSWYKKSAEKGYAPAQERLADLFYTRPSFAINRGLSDFMESVDNRKFVKIVKFDKGL